MIHLLLNLYKLHWFRQGDNIAFYVLRGGVFDVFGADVCFAFTLDVLWGYSGGFLATRALSN